MKILVVGAGPAGLMFASQMKNKMPECHISIIEKNTPEEILGWGVVLPGKAGQHPANPLSYIDIPEKLDPQYINEFKLSQDDQHNMVSTGLTLCGVERIGLVKALRELCLSLDINIEYSSPAMSEPELNKKDYDLVVISNGVNHKSTYFTEKFEPNVDFGKNKYIWYGTSRIFNSMNLAFRSHLEGIFVAHAYKYSSDMSTFVVECSEETYHKTGIEYLSEKESAEFIGKVFEKELAGHSLISQEGLGWRNFMTLSHEIARDENLVLLGDAQQSGHFSIGQGTTMAVVEAQILIKSLLDENDVSKALSNYEAEAMPIIKLFRSHANISREWFETVNDRTDLSLNELTTSFGERRNSLPSLPETLMKVLGKIMGPPPGARP